MNDQQLIEKTDKAEIWEAIDATREDIAELTGDFKAWSQKVDTLTSSIGEVKIMFQQFIQSRNDAKKIYWNKV